MLLTESQKQQIASDANVPSFIVDNIEYHFWSYLKKQMASDIMPIIAIRGLGVFRPSRNKLKYIILALIAHIRAGTNVIENKYRLSQYWKARNELINYRKQ
jgi:hypothetical protein